MKGVVCLGDRAVEVREFPDEKPGVGEVLLKMRASGMCGSDLKNYRRESSELNQLPTASTVNRMGHEPCGEVVELGAGVTFPVVGQRVIVHHYRGCGQCKYCTRGYNQLCLKPGPYTRYYGGSGHGGHGDYMTVPARVLVPLPDELSYEEGAMVACGTSTAYLGLTKLKVSGLDVLAVFGQGPVGVSATMLGTVMGARVIAVDPSPDRLQLAKDSGAWETVNPSDGDSVEQILELTGGEGADATLEAVGFAETRKQSVSALKVFGRTVLIGEGTEQQKVLDVAPDIIHNHLTIMGSWTVSTFGLEETASFIVDRQIPLGELISDRVYIDDAVDAYKRFDRQDTGKMIIVWD